MPTVTPFPTLTPIPVGTPMVNIAPVMNMLQDGSLGPQAIQWWHMSIGPLWGAVSGFILLILVVLIVVTFVYQFRGED